MRTIIVCAVLLTGCSSGLQERAFQNEHGVYIVSQSLVNDRITSNQPHLTGGQACFKKYTSEEMAGFRSEGDEHSWYYQCQKLDDYKPGQYATSMDQPVATLYKGPIEAAIMGGSVGAGLALSGDTITQRGTAAAGASATGQGGNAVSGGRRWHRR